MTAVIELFFLPIVFLIWGVTLLDIWRTEALDVLRIPRAGWLFVAATMPLVGTVGWIMLGRPNRRPGRRVGGIAPRPVGPEDDPNWLVNTTPSKPLSDRRG